MEFERFFKYIYLVIIHLMAFSMMYSKNLEMLGYAVGIIMSFITSGFLWKDIYYSPKSTDPVLYVILPSILLGTISLFIFATFLTNTHSKYNAKGSKIILTKETRRNLNTFRSFYVWGYLAIAIISLMFFLIYKPPAANSVFMPFFQIPTSVLSIDTILLAFKVLLSVGTLGATAGMVYYANKLKKQNSKQVYVPKDRQGEVPDKYPYRYKRPRTTMMDDIRWFFRNISMNYVMNYNISRID